MAHVITCLLPWNITQQLAKRDFIPTSVWLVHLRQAGRTSIYHRSLFNSPAPLPEPRFLRRGDSWPHLDLSWPVHPSRYVAVHANDKHILASAGEDWASHSATRKAPPSFLLLPCHMWHQRQDQCQAERISGDPWWRKRKKKKIPLAAAKFIVGLMFTSWLCVSSVGYSWLPLLKEGRLSSQEFNIPVSCNLPPGYLAIKEANNTKVTTAEKKKE